ncbi:hypothetical protein TNCV_3522901 [Trichonephila clavipes]|uniref:Uncharacterized protein n=1 Tax=Trichonephila clavipes TaxID=2585209 RepID=A0A8X7BHG7_TRICX|nr:hypothetical protein TNCV_3522901 [Trichonephila clavipes]
MLITFFDDKGFINKEFVPSGQTITGQYYLAVLKLLMDSIRRIRSEYRTENGWCSFYDNEPTFLVVCRFLAKNNICVGSSTVFTCPKQKMKL